MIREKKTYGNRIHGWTRGKAEPRRMRRTTPFRYSRGTDSIMALRKKGGRRKRTKRSSKSVYQMNRIHFFLFLLIYYVMKLWKQFTFFIWVFGWFFLLRLKLEDEESKQINWWNGKVMATMAVWVAVSRGR